MPWQHVRPLQPALSWRHEVFTLVVIAIPAGVTALFLVGRPGLALGALAVSPLLVLLAWVFVPARTIRWEESVLVPFEPAVVWALIEPAENAPLLDMNVRAGHHVDGTPHGVGQRQSFELVDGSTSVIEVVEYEAGRRAVIRNVTEESEAGNDVRSWQVVTPTGVGCRYAFGIEFGPPRRHLRRHPLEELWRAHARAQLQRTLEVLTAQIDDRPPTDPTPRSGGPTDPVP